MHFPCLYVALVHLKDGVAVGFDAVPLLQLGKRTGGEMNREQRKATKRDRSRVERCFARSEHDSAADFAALPR